MDYKIVEDTSASRLAQKVKEHLAAGWKLQGGIAVRTQLSGSDEYYQALVKEESTPANNQT